MTYATTDDVAVDYGDIGDDATTLTRVHKLLERAEARVRQVCNPEQRIEDGLTTVELIQQVESEMVAAALRNPEAWQSVSESEGPFTRSHTINLAVASGLLRLTPDHRELLGERTLPGPFTVQLSTG